MGIQLILAAQNPYWAQQLKPAAQVVLGRMATRAMDKPSNGNPAACYFAGHEDLALALDGAVDDVALRKVRRAIADLEAAGAITRDRRGAGQRSARYTLTLDNYRLPPDDTAPTPARGTPRPPVDNDADGVPF